MIEFPKRLRPLIDIVIDRYPLDIDGSHGMPHWQRVLRNGYLIAAADRAVDTEVVILFALLHDSRRRDEDEDIMHGVRGARFAQKLYDHGHLHWLRKGQLTRLKAAICDHPLGLMTMDRTIQACWDADRLDLGRVGIKPNLSLLGSHYAQGKGVIERHWREHLLGEEVPMA